jgi:dGTP triphosphohydrolase
LTLKHINVDKCLQNVAVNEKNVVNKPYACHCGKQFSHRQSLSIHKKKCIKKSTDEMLLQMVLDVVKSNTEICKTNAELCKNNNGSMIISHNNSHNKTFNMQLFLNETCKDAMNIMDFVNDIKINLNDLEDVGKLGYVEGISNIIIKNLKGLEVNKRPVHCSDLKREVLYVKDEDHWSKEKEKMNYAIKHIAHKNIQMLPEWKQQNPAYSLSDGCKNDQFMRIVNESMGGSDKKEEQVYQEKIITKVAKHVVVEK